MGFKIAASAAAKEFKPYGDIMIDRGYPITYLQNMENNEDSVIERLMDFDAAIAFGELFTEKVFAALSGRLKIVCRFGLGYDKVDLASATKYGVCVTNTAGTMAAAVAEIALLLMLECCRRAAKHDAQMQKGIWELSFQGSQLSGKTVGLIGFGNISQKLARFCRGLGCNVLAYDISFNKTAADNLGVKYAELDKIARNSDFISLHVPLSPTTKHIVNAEFLKKMKHTAYLINTSRGPTVDEQSLIAALDDKTIAGAGLDVYAHEPLEPGSKLRGRDNVILTPHYASFTHEAYMETIVDIMETLDSFQAGAVPKHCLNPDYARRMRRV